MDIDSIPYGMDYREQIQEALAGVDVLLAVVGPNWVARQPDGRARIHDETDLVRIEVEVALQRRIPVVPVLVGGGAMPAKEELPDSLSRFAYHNAAEVDAGRDFRPHMDRLTGAIDAIVARGRQASPPQLADAGASEPHAVAPGSAPRPEPPAVATSIPTPTPVASDASGPAVAARAGVGRLALAGLLLTVLLAAAYFIVALSLLMTVAFSAGSVVVGVVAGYGLHRRLGALGVGAALVGLCSGFAAMVIAFIYQEVDLRAGLPILTLDDNEAMIIPMAAYAVSVSLAALAGNLASQLRSLADRTRPLGRLARSFGATSGPALERTKLLAGAVAAAALAGAAWFGYLAWFPFCRGYMVYEFCTYASP